MNFLETSNVLRSQSSQFSHSQTQPVTTQTNYKAMNKNIQHLKKLPKTTEMFDEIYATLNHIAIENDFDAMNFAMKEKFCDENIFEHSIKIGNFQLARLIKEFSENCNYSHITFNDSDFIRLTIKTPHFNVNEALASLSRNNHVEHLKYLLTIPGIDVNSRDKYYWTALIWASSYGYHEVVKLLLSVPGIDVNAKDINNWTPLMWASVKGHHEVVKLLLSVPGIDINAKDIYNCTAIKWAVAKGRLGIARILYSVPGIKID